MGYSDILTEENLHKWHWVEMLSLADIRRKVGCSGPTVNRYFKLHGIQTRNSEYYDSLINTNRNKITYLYNEEKYSLAEIAEIYNISYPTLKKYMNKWESIQLRSAAEQQKLEDWAERNRVGENNPFYGKTHTKESIQQMLANRDDSVWKTDEFRRKMSKITSGENNGMYGRSFYDVWVERYGKKLADEKMNEFKRKISLAMSGKNNPMYGKPAPKKSGNGWSGWYKNKIYFQSLKELSFIHNYLERFGFIYQRVKSNHPILYVFGGKSKNYFPDFLVNEKYIVEIKPHHLFNTGINKAKFKAAILYCSESGFKFKLIDPIRLKPKEITFLIRDGLVSFDEGTIKKFVSNQLDVDL